MKICLFALTGFGNIVLEALSKISFVDDVIVFTRKENERFPYYECDYIVNLCKERNIKFYLDKKVSSRDTYKKIIDFSPDIILVATFHQKIPKNIIELSKKGAINIHPSLLPKYRGPTPTHWTIINGEEKAGITFHFIDKEFDKGDILFQKEVSIGDLTDGELRRRLAVLAGEVIEEFLSNFVNGRLKPHPQKAEEGSYHPKITSQEAIVLLKSGNYKRENIIRGLSPYPGIKILE